MNKAERASRRAAAAALRRQHGAHAADPCQVCLVLELVAEDEDRLAAIREQARAIVGNDELGRVEAYEAAERLVEELAK